MNCPECSSMMLLEYSCDGVEVYTCPYCGATDTLDFSDYGSEYDDD